MKRRLLFEHLLKSIGLLPFIGWSRETEGAQFKLEKKDISETIALELAFQNPQVSLLRSDDLLNLRFEFINMIQKNNQLVLKNTKDKAYLIVHFPPQHINEASFYKEPYNPSKNLKNPPVDAQLARESRLVFSISKNQFPLAYTTETLLAWHNYQLSVSPSARGVDKRKFDLSHLTRQFNAVINKNSSLQGYVTSKPNLTFDKINSISPTSPLGEFRSVSQISKPAIQANVAAFVDFKIPAKIEKPKIYQTAIYAPFRLAISPSGYNSWIHSISAVEHTTPSGGGARTELWHTRLGTRVKAEDGSFSVDEQDTMQRIVRAIWSPDYASIDWPSVSCPKESLENQIGSLSKSDRNAIVHLTADYNLPFVKPVNVNQLMLTSLGAWMDLHGEWKPDGNKINLEEWKHRTTAGRDQYVKKAYKGYLFPFGHEAQLIVIIQREVHDGIAYLRTINYISVKQAVVYIPKPPGIDEISQQGRKLPFSRVEIKTLTTPMLDEASPDEKIDTGSCSENGYRWPKVKSQYVQFHMFAHDWDGRASEFTMPLMWVASTSVSNKAKALNKILTYIQQKDARTRSMTGQKIAFAKSDQSGDTSIETATITFVAHSKATAPYFYPVMESADIRLSAAAQLSGNTSETFPVVFFPEFIKYEFLNTENPSKIFLQKKPKLPANDIRGRLNFNGSQSGGVVTPNMQIGGVSREFGPIGGNAKKLNQFAGAATPSNQPDNSNEFFKGFFSDAKILGGIELSAILKPSFDGGKNIPRLITSTEYDSNDVPVQIITKYQWSPKVQNYLVFKASRNNTQASLNVDVEMVADLKNQSSTSQIKGNLENFSFSLFDILFMKFNYFRFSSKNAQKPDFSVEFDEIEFVGILSFLEALKDIIKLDGFSDPPGLDIDQNGVRLDYSLAVPPVQLGAFALQNIQLSAGLNLPFTNDPMRFRFAFAERHNPFALTVSLFSGGGFFAIGAGIDGIETIEASLEFGGNIAISLGVASGQVVVMGGIYFKWELGEVALTGYVRAAGAMQVLGLITVSMEFYMGLTYDFGSKKAVGRASVRVEIDLVFVSKSVSVSMERRFSGSKGDPTFKQVMSDDPNDPRLANENQRWNEQHANYWESYCDAFADFDAQSPSNAPQSNTPQSTPNADQYWYQTW